MIDEIYDYSELRLKIKKSGYNLTEFAELLGISNVTLSEKLNNRSEFSQAEMFKVKDILNCSNRDIIRYFFTKILKKS